MRSGWSYWSIFSGSGQGSVLDQLKITVSEFLILWMVSWTLGMYVLDFMLVCCFILQSLVLEKEVDD